MASRSKKKENSQKMTQDSHGISRKKEKHTFPPTLFIIFKLILIGLIPILYFVYSPLIIFDLILYVSLFFIARITEKTVNKNVARSSHIHIFKADSALALIIILIAVFGVFLNLSNKTKKSTFDGIPSDKMELFMKNFDENLSSSNSERPSFPGGGFPFPGGGFSFESDDSSSNEKLNLPSFKDMKKFGKTNQFLSVLKNLGSVLTGERNVFSSKNSFGITAKPENFIKSSEEFKNLNFEDSNMSEKEDIKASFEKRKNNFSMDKIPIEYMSSSAISSVNTILVFSLCFVGAFSVLVFVLKLKKFNTVMNKVVLESKVEILSDEEINRILSFGEEIDEVELTSEEINQKINEVLKEDSKKNNETLAEPNVSKEKVEILDQKFEDSSEYDEDEDDENFGF